MAWFSIIFFIALCVAEYKVRESKREAFISTSEHTIEGYKIINSLGTVTVEYVFRSANGLTKAKQMALSRLVDSCIKLDANAAIDIDVEVSVLSRENMLVATAKGTAVTIERIEE